MKFEKLTIVFYTDKRIDFDVIKSIDKKTKFTVYGYFHRNEKLLSSNLYHVIPDGIINLCLLFYRNVYEWNKKYLAKEHWKIDGNRIIKMRDGYASAFINGDAEYGINRWKLKIENFSNLTYGMMIGIWKKDMQQIDTRLNTWFPSGGNIRDMVYIQMDV